MRKQTSAGALRAVVVATAAMSSSTMAATIVNDTFTSETVGVAPASYTAGGGLTGIVLNTVNDGNNLSTGGGNALSVELSASTRYASRAFSAQTLAVGDTITASFDVRIALPTTTLPVGDRTFRFGLYNSTAASVGYTGRLDGGVAAGNSIDIFQSNGVFNTATANGSVSLISGAQTDPALDDNTVRHVTLTLALGSTGITSSLTVQKGSNTPVTITDPTPNAAPANTYYTLDQFLIGFNGTAGSPGQTGGANETFNLDNVLINYTPGVAPEPVSLVAAVAGVGGLLGRRRRG